MKFRRYTKSFNLAVILFLFTGLSGQIVASTGNLKGACWSVAIKRFPDAELVGMLGGNMSNFNVTGYLLDRQNKPHEFFCAFPYSHGQPKAFQSELFAHDKKDPAAFTRKHVEHLKVRESQAYDRERMRNKILEDLMKK